MLTESPAAPLILLVEDDSGHAAAILRAFENAQENYRLRIVTTLNAAREALDRHKPALVLADYRLPDGSGSDLVRATDEACPVVLMTARGSEQIAVQALKAGVQDYVIKSSQTFAHMPQTINNALKAWSLIQARKQAEEDLRRYARRLIEMEEELRKKLSAELHDEIGRDLTVLGVNFSIISSELAEQTSQQVYKRIDDSARLVREISRTTRNIMNGLRPPVIDDYGLVPALRWQSDLFSSRTGVAVFIHAEEPFPRLPSAIELTLFRIAQEALFNTSKHAQATLVAISLQKDEDAVMLDIADDGIGSAVTPPSGPQNSGWGMTLMRERCELVGGRFSMTSLPGHGTVVSVEIPLEET
jgi:signal transduction histidine kinase